MYQQTTGMSNAYVKTEPAFTIADLNTFKIQMLNWANQFNIFCFLDNHQYHHNIIPSEFECLLAVGCKNFVQAEAGKAFDQLKNFANTRTSWLFGHLGYDLKNETEFLSSDHPNRIGFPDMFFFEPEIIITVKNNSVTIEGDNSTQVFNEILSYPDTIHKFSTTGITIQNTITQQQYIETIKKLKEHIHYGDCYEINFCQEFFIENIAIDPLTLYHRFSKISPSPFGTFYKLNNKYCIGASPERYLKKTGNTLLSQPIKGTAKRDLQNHLIDEANKNYLRTSKKEKSENITVVDLVRNDLSKVCKAGSVKAEELCGIYSFPQVHQMISTISGEMKENMYWVDAIQATFPMGSMTGAPKRKVLELIEQYENTKRGLYSGAIGYITLQNDFDFNVVIRSIFYNQNNQYLSYNVGSGITYYSDPEKEYEECLLKMAAFKNIFNNI